MELADGAPLSGGGQRAHTGYTEWLGRDLTFRSLEDEFSDLEV